MIRRLDSMSLAAAVLMALLLLSPWGPARAQETGPAVVLEQEMEITDTDAGHIYAGVSKIPYLVTAGTVVIDPEGSLTTLSQVEAPFMAQVKFTPPLGQEESALPVVVEIKVLAEQPR
ncbi:MAG: hypothetical protein AB1896_07610 [Thermodesulfobacteriota bacterium]